MSSKGQEHATGKRYAPVMSPLAGGEPPPPPPPNLLHDRPRGQRNKLREVGLAVVLLVTGALLGLYFAPEGPRELKAQLAGTQQALAATKARMATLEQSMQDAEGADRGVLKSGDRSRHERAGRHYVHSLRRAQAQGAAQLMEWFIHRWDQLLDFPQEDDRTGRRAATLALLVGGMAENLNEGDFVPWQAEFLSSAWLGELHFDMDNDGLPGKRSGANTHDGFANVSICHVAMALNQAMTDGRVLVMPNMRCDRPEARMSVFLQGKTLDDALSEFVKQVREQGFIVKEKLEKGVRLVLVSARPPPPRDD